MMQQMISVKESQELLIIFPEDSKAPEVRKASAGFSTSMWLSVSSTTWDSL